MKAWKKALDVASTVMLVLFVVFIILLVGVRLFGIEPHIVVSGSMEPKYLTGSLVYVDPMTREEACNLKAGDDVTYLVDNKGTKVTHRIYEVVGPAYVKNQHGEVVMDENGQPVVAKDDRGYPIIMYVTYGINNKNSSDPSGYTLDGAPGVGNLASSNVFGKPVFTIPFLGYVASFVQNPPGKYVAIALCALLLASSLLSGFFKKEEQKKDAAVAPAAEEEHPAEGGNAPAEAAESAVETAADESANTCAAEGGAPAEAEADGLAPAEGGEADKDASQN